MGSRSIRTTRNSRNSAAANLISVADDGGRWYGPRTLTQVRQVCIPIALLRALELDVGSELEFALDEDSREIRIREFGTSARLREASTGAEESE